MTCVLASGSAWSLTEEVENDSAVVIYIILNNEEEGF